MPRGATLIQQTIGLPSLRRLTVPTDADYPGKTGSPAHSGVVVYRPFLHGSQQYRAL